MAGAKPMTKTHKSDGEKKLPQIYKAKINKQKLIQQYMPALKQTILKENVRKNNFRTVD